MHRSVNLPVPAHLPPPGLNVAVRLPGARAVFTSRPASGPARSPISAGRASSAIQEGARSLRRSPARRHPSGVVEPLEVGDCRAAGPRVATEKGSVRRGDSVSPHRLVSPLHVVAPQQVVAPGGVLDHGTQNEDGPGIREALASMAASAATGRIVGVILDWDAAAK